jgi:WD40 repeat protein
VKLDSTIRSISLSANQQELVLSCSSGAIYRALVANLNHGVISVSTNSSITSIAFPTMPYPTAPSVMYFATGTESGEIRVWDLTDYACLSALKVPKAGSVLCLTMIDSDHIISGWKDGSIRCSDSNGRQLWYLPTAHRDGTTTVAAHVEGQLQYFVTGGGDGAIRVWKYSNRELITQYTEHRKGVIRVLVDNQQPNIVHSVGGDGSILSYDLKAGRRITCHIVNNGSMMNMTQKKEREYEVVTCDSVGRLLFWDIDIRDPVVAVQDPSKTTIRINQISPSGRFLAFAGDDQILKILDMQSFQIISLGQSHSAPILALHWTPDEKQIITGGADCCLSVWNFYLGGVK